MTRRSFSNVWFGGSCVSRILLASPIAALGASRDYISASRKLESIEFGQLAPGASVTFSPAEVNAYASAELAGERIAGVRKPYVALGEASAVGSAMIDFLKVHQSFTGDPPGQVAQFLFGGEKEVIVDASIRGANGTCVIQPRSVSINGIEIRGGVLDWLIENFLVRRFPTAKVNRPFELPHRVERVDITPSGVRVRMMGSLG